VSKRRSSHEIALARLQELFTANTLMRTPFRTLERSPTWGTLKRGPSDEEIKLFEWEKLTLSNEQEQSLFSEYDNEVEGKGARANVLDYVNLDTFAQSLQQFNSKNSDFCVGGPHDGYRAQSLVENNIKITQGLDVNEVSGGLGNKKS